MHFCGIEALNEIGNALGKLVTIGWDRIQKGLVTYARICMEVDLSVGFPNQITLTWSSKSWVINIEYENAAFRCRSCQQTGHLQGSCPLARPSKKKKPKPRMKRWDNLNPNETSESEDEVDGMVQNAEKNGLEEVMNQDIQEEAPMQSNANPHKIFWVCGAYRSCTRWGKETS